MPVGIDLRRKMSKTKNEGYSEVGKILAYQEMVRPRTEEENESRKKRDKEFKEAMEKWRRGIEREGSLAHLFYLFRSIFK